MSTSAVLPRTLQGFAEVPADVAYTLANVNVPLACVRGIDASKLVVDHDNLALCDIHVRDGRIVEITAPQEQHETTVVDLEGGCAWPTFVDVHTHIDKAHTCERSRNPTGNLTGADSSTAKDASFWNLGDVFWRMDFCVRCAYAHGTSALRTHLINMIPKQIELTWPAFNKLRAKWKGKNSSSTLVWLSIKITGLTMEERGGRDAYTCHCVSSYFAVSHPSHKVELQGVSLVTLSFFRNRNEAMQLADVVAQHGGILGAAVCCSDRGGKPDDDWTTCEEDRDELLDFIFTLASERNLLLDFHVDENGNSESKGLRHIAAKTIQHNYQGRVVCGHCCSLAFQSPSELEETLALAAKAKVTVVSLPLVNEWTQDRCPSAARTPRWRGITTLHELRASGVPTAMASDNARDQFYAYGDLDMLEVFTQGVRMGQLDRPHSEWPASVTCVPADAMHLPDHGRITVGGPANLVLFRARRYSELLSRPQVDRVVIRDGHYVSAVPPDYKLLDYNPQTHEYLYQAKNIPRGSFRVRNSCAGAAPKQQCSEAGSAPTTMNGDSAPRHIDASLVRGLSTVLSHEAVSSPSSRNNAFSTTGASTCASRSCEGQRAGRPRLNALSTADTLHSDRATASCSGCDYDGWRLDRQSAIDHASSSNVQQHSIDENARQELAHDGYGYQCDRRVQAGHIVSKKYYNLSKWNLSMIVVTATAAGAALALGCSHVLLPSARK